MKNQMFTTPQEQQRISARTQEILARLDGQTPVNQLLVTYAIENGCSQEEARQLVEETIIPTVDEYNSSCIEALEGDTSEWVRDRIAERVEEMSLSEEFRYKLTFLRALQRADQVVLNQAGLLEGQAWEESYQQICESEEVFPADGDVTEEMLAQLNEELARTIENTTLPLYNADAFETLVEGRMDEESVKVFVFDMWKDETVKYCAAIAACVAHRSGELSSIPEDTPDRVIAVGICQGMDVVNIQQRVALGELTADAAFELLRAVGMVALVLLGGYLAFRALEISLVAAQLIAILMNGGIIATLAISGLMMGAALNWVDKGLDLFEKFLAGAGSVAEVTYGKLKQGAKKVFGIVKDRILPGLQSFCGSALTFIRRVFGWARGQAAQLIAGLS